MPMYRIEKFLVRAEDPYTGAFFTAWENTDKTITSVETHSLESDSSVWIFENKKAFMEAITWIDWIADGIIDKAVRKYVKGYGDREWVCDCCKKVLKDTEPFGQCDTLDEHKFCEACIKKAGITYKDMEDGYYTKDKCPVCRKTDCLKKKEEKKHD